MSDYAIVAANPGGPEVLQWQPRPETPRPDPFEVLVRTHAVGVNFIEIYQRSGVYPVPFPFTPGTEASGVIVAVGEQVPHLAVGDRVTTCEATATYAEHFTVRADRVVQVPESISFELAAAIPLQGLTAHYLHTSASNPKPGEWVLLHAGAGGVGLLLTQFLADKGVRVITTASTPKKREFSIGAGAEFSIPYENFTEAVREITHGDGVSVVYDSVGKDTFEGSIDALAVRGNFVLFGGSSGQVPPFDVQRLNSAGSLSITRPSLVHFLRSHEERMWRYREVLEANHRGSLEVNVGHTFPLAEARAAQEALESRATTGKVVLTTEA